MTKKVVLGIVLTAMLCTLLITYKHLQQPTEKDVMNITKNWSDSAKEVYLIRETDEQWQTIFRNSQSVIIAKLKQNWLGTWKLSEKGTLSSTYYPPLEDDQITWSASGKSKENVSYYFGVIIDPEIVKITVETQKGIFENAQIIKSDGLRFFLKKAHGPIYLPVNISCYSKSEELIYSSKFPVHKKVIVQ
ncbi:hypothetical protein [Lysinibacillus sp. 38-6]|uniref:hypothetical protein n=1 Tax=Lysinibacillus sp. 38-6 TaxID=3385991 RepID=UPI003908B100